nr:RPM1-interacting protein 4-like isoform X1 [Ipomoea batatas]
MNKALPKFGEWDVNDPNDYSFIFDKARKERRALRDGTIGDQPESKAGRKLSSFKKRNADRLVQRHHSSKKWFCCQGFHSPKPVPHLHQGSGFEFCLLLVSDPSYLASSQEPHFRRLLFQTPNFSRHNQLDSYFLAAFLFYDEASESLPFPHEYKFLPHSKLSSARPFVLESPSVSARFFGGLPLFRGRFCCSSIFPSKFPFSDAKTASLLSSALLIFFGGLPLLRRGFCSGREASFIFSGREASFIFSGFTFTTFSTSETPLILASPPTEPALPFPSVKLTASSNRVNSGDFSFSSGRCSSSLVSKFKQISSLTSCSFDPSIALPPSGFNPPT